MASRSSHRWNARHLQDPLSRSKVALGSWTAMIVTTTGRSGNRYSVAGRLALLHHFMLLSNSKLLPLSEENRSTFFSGASTWLLVDETDSCNPLRNQCTLVES